ncbi:hypothetical protein LSO9J_10013 [Candidatus Liberibacter solanacearum]
MSIHAPLILSLLKYLLLISQLGFHNPVPMPAPHKYLLQLTSKVFLFRVPVIWCIKS